MFSPNITITETGFVYIYISNEEATPIDVFFDDFKVTQNMSEVMAGADYYPFGLPIPERELTREPYRYGYQGQFSEKDKETGFNFFDLRMYDARIGRWVSPDPYGQYASAYVGMGNMPNMGTDPGGGWAWNTFAIGFGVGAAVGYAATGDLKGALIGGAAGGLLGGAMFKRTWVPISGGFEQLGFLTRKTVLSPFGRGVANTFERLFVPISNTLLDEVVINGGKHRDAPRIGSDGLKGIEIPKVSPPPPLDPNKFRKEKEKGPPPCPDLNSVSFVDGDIAGNAPAAPYIGSGLSVLGDIAAHLRAGGRVRVTHINTRFPLGTRTHHSHAGQINPKTGEVLINKTHFNMPYEMGRRLHHLKKVLEKFGAPKGSINTSNVTPYYNQDNSNVGFECY